MHSGIARTRRLSALGGLVLIVALAAGALLAGAALSASEPMTAREGEALIPLLVQFKSDVSPNGAAAAVKAAGGSSVREFAQIHARVVMVAETRKAQALTSLRNNPAVRRANPTVSFTKAGDVVNDPHYGDQWAL